MTTSPGTTIRCFFAAAILTFLVGSPAAQAQLSLGAFGLLNRVGVSGDVPLDGSWAPGFQFGGGITADLQLSSEISVCSGVQWDRRTTALQYTIPHPTEPRQDTTVDSLYINTNYISIPVGMQVFSRSRHWYFGTGFTVQILQQLTADSSGQEFEVEGVLRDVDVALYLSAAYQFHFDPLYPYIELRYQQGLFDLVGSTPGNLLRDSPVIRMSGLQLLVGVSWRISS